MVNSIVLIGGGVSILGIYDHNTPLEAMGLIVSLGVAIVAGIGAIFRPKEASVSSDGSVVHMIYPQLFMIIPIMYLMLMIFGVVPYSDRAFGVLMEVMGINLALENRAHSDHAIMIRKWGNPSRKTLNPRLSRLLIALGGVCWVGLGVAIALGRLPLTPPR